MSPKTDRREQIQEDIRRDLARRRRESVLIVVFGLVFGLVFYLQFRFSKIAEDSQPFDLSTGLIFFTFSGLMVLLALVLIFLVVRNVVKLLFERRSGIIGAHLRTRLVVAFIGLTLGPTAVLFGLSTFFLNASMARWFDPQVQAVFDTSRGIIRNTYEDGGEQALHFGRQIARTVSEQHLLEQRQEAVLHKFLEEKLAEYRLGMIEILDGRGRVVTWVAAPELGIKQPAAIAAEAKEKVLGSQEGYFTEPAGSGDLLWGLVPIPSSGPPRSVVGAVAAGKFVEQSLARQLRQNLAALEEYQRLKIEQSPIKRQHSTLLILITLVVIFLAVWFGFYLAKGITVPIQLLVEGTREVASGNLNYRIEVRAEDEIGALVEHFNTMTGDLSRSRAELDRASEELRHTNLELDRRRRYMETVLTRVAAGVFSVDAAGRLSTLNPAAEMMLGLKRDEVLGRPAAQVLPENLAAYLRELRDTWGRDGQETIERQIDLTGLNQTRLLRVTATRLMGDDGADQGLVAVLDDLSQIIRAQRALAWREVARRIAHEIKNPLTPIQLSAQRLQRHYAETLPEDDRRLLTEATGTIITQVEELKELVNEFSTFARLPATNPAPNDLNAVLAEAVALYSEAHREIAFELIEEKRVPRFDFDRDQLKRAFINLLDNAVDSIAGPGRIEVESLYNEQLELVRVEVRDSGRGIRPEDRERIFEPYYSTKPRGTGLGLAIVRRIITDHYGYIRVAPNSPQGTQVIVELPITATARAVRERAFGEEVRSG
jgi:two-component system nitrogen regulation sensor histidine kinase NtrY